MKRCGEFGFTLLGLVVAVIGGGGCTAALDWVECSESKACPTGYLCEAGECIAGTSGKPIVEVSQSITTDTVWTSDNDYVLKDVIFVAPNARLTIRSGTRVLGEQGAALVVRSGGRLEARGTKSAPIVFTSAKAEGQRAPEDWGGVVLLGKARANIADAEFEALDDPTLGAYGGTDDKHSCGVLQYTRIEFAGYARTAGAEFSGLTLAGCGSDTLVDNLQVHASAYDGVQVLGGTVGLNHVVLTKNARNAMAWNYGWRGTAQFVFVQQGNDDKNAMHSSNNPTSFAAQPVSEPTIFNFTLIGSGAKGGNQRAMYLEAGGGGHFSNGIVLGQSFEALDIVGEVTAALFVLDRLEISYTLFFDIGAEGTHFFPLPAEEGGADDDDGGFNEDAWFKTNDDANAFAVDPQLAGPYGLDPAGWVPPQGALAGLATRPPIEFDQAGNYLGAFQPGGEPWSSGWVSFPVN